MAAAAFPALSCDSGFEHSRLRMLPKFPPGDRVAATVIRPERGKGSKTGEPIPILHKQFHHHCIDEGVLCLGDGFPNIVNGSILHLASVWETRTQRRFPNGMYSAFRFAVSCAWQEKVVGYANELALSRTAAYPHGRDTVSIPEILGRLGVEIVKQDQVAANRVARCLKVSGWKRVYTGPREAREWRYRRVFQS